MKKRILIAMLFCIVMALALSFSVSAECQSHTNEWTLTLGQEGFLGEIGAEGKCSECSAVTKETIPALFITRGYSYSSDGIAQGYGINREAIARYEELSGERVKFGGVLAIRDVIGNQNPLDKNAEPISSKVQKMDLTDTEYSIINIMVKGIPESEADSIGIICALYINAGGQTTYVDNRVEKVNCGEKTFNEVKAGPTADTSAMPEYAVIDGQRYHQMTIDELQLTQGKFWNNSSIQASNNATFDNKFWATGVSFTKNDLPIGTIITIDSDNGWQYRPHKWSGTRPNNTKDKKIVIDEAWWGSYTYVGFNIGKYDGEGATQATDPMLDISGYTAEQIAQIFKIFVPVTIGEVTPNEPDTPVTPDEPLPDYSDQKQDWDADGELKILAIGNSFSVDSMEYVYQVAQSAGIEKVTLGNLYIGGCSLDTHLSNATNNANAYTYYYTNTNGTWSSKGGQSIKTAVESDDWDFITLQQVSGYSGVSSSYSALNSLIGIVEPLNPSARLVWHMTWAYQSGSDHADFAKYNRDQMTMYNAIINAVQDNIVTNDKIEIIIPAGTAIQNVRTSYIGDTLTRDGYHLSTDYGRLIGSLTFVKALTGVSIDDVEYMPNGVDEGELAVAIEAVNNAYENPFEVTNSTYTENPDEEIITGTIVGYNQLTATEMGIMEDSYYNTSGSNVFNSTDAFAQGYFATKKFTKSELPIGTVLEIADGWQYRPEGWNYTGSRPDNVAIYRVTIDESWWGSYTERAFNISKIGHTTSNVLEITQTPDEIAQSIFKIYVPVFDDGDDSTIEAPELPTLPEEPSEEIAYVNSSDCASEVVTIDGKEYRALTIDAMGLTASQYYFSEQEGPTFYQYPSSAQATANKFFGTTTFTKSTLPDGAVIWVNSGWQYRPEGWIGGATNSSSSRPGNTSATYTTVNSDWWGSWTVRGFNISKTNGADISGYTNEQVYENFKIYIPVENIKEGA